LFGFDRRERLGEEVGRVFVSGDVFKLEGFFMFNVVSEPVILHVDVLVLVLVN
jgi:hypothetical protein